MDLGVWVGGVTKLIFIDNIKVQKALQVKFFNFINTGCGKKPSEFKLTPFNFKLFCVFIFLFVYRYYLEVLFLCRRWTKIVALPLTNSRSFVRPYRAYRQTALSRPTIYTLKETLYIQNIAEVMESWTETLETSKWKRSSQLQFSDRKLCRISKTKLNLI